MTTVLLIRHGRTTANSDGVLAGRTKGVELDPVGREQAVAAADRIRGVTLAAVVTSPLVRCRQTAQALVAERADELRPQVERGLIECGYGSWTGRSIAELAKEKLWATVQQQPSAVRFPDGESMIEMSARAVASIRSWNASLRETGGEDAVWAAISHGDVIKAILADALGLHLDSFQRIVVNPAAISVIRYAPDRPYVWMMNSMAGDLTDMFAKPHRGRRRRRTASEPGAAVGGGLGTQQS